MTDYIQPGKNIVVGQAVILWSDSFIHPESGYMGGAWILPGCIRTSSPELALYACNVLNESIKMAALGKQQTIQPEDIGSIIRRQFMKLEG